MVRVIKFTSFFNILHKTTQKKEIVGKKDSFFPTISNLFLVLLLFPFFLGFVFLFCQLICIILICLFEFTLRRNFVFPFVYFYIFFSFFEEVDKIISFFFRLHMRNNKNSWFFLIWLQRLETVKSVRFFFFFG